MRGPPFFLVGGEGGGVFCSSCVWCGDWTVHFSLGSEFFMQVFFFSSFFWWFILGGPKEGTLYFKRKTSILGVFIITKLSLSRICAFTMFQQYI
jgi:hypothetical protein